MQVPGPLSAPKKWPGSDLTKKKIVSNVCSFSCLDETHDTRGGHLRFFAILHFLADSKEPFIGAQWCETIKIAE